MLTAVKTRPAIWNWPLRRAREGFGGGRGVVVVVVVVVVVLATDVTAVA
jgi:hypothetical protein